MQNQEKNTDWDVWEHRQNERYLIIPLAQQENKDIISIDKDGNKLERIRMPGTYFWIKVIKLENNLGFAGFHI